MRRQVQTEELRKNLRQLLKEASEGQPFIVVDGRTGRRIALVQPVDESTPDRDEKIYL